MTEHETEDGAGHGPTVRDKRRIDPQTYQVREPQPSAAAPGPGGAPGPTTEAVPEPGISAELQQLQSALAERTADLQRLQAEYVNYKRRVDRDRELARKAALEGFVKDFLPVLDDVRSAREHGELTGAFKAVGDEVERVTARYGLETFGTKGDPFDPHVHDALMHMHQAGVTGPTCVEILQPGYRIGERVLRPARVAVAEPSDEPEAEPAPEHAPAEPSADASTTDAGTA